MKAPLATRLHSRLMLHPGSGCLLWTGAVTPAGYGRIKVSGECRYVHIVAWELGNGPVPDGLVLDHVRARGCIYRHCANTVHLEPVTQRENLLRGDTIAARNAAATHCPARHPYDAANTRIDRDGKRHCRECNREQTAASRLRFASADPASFQHGTASTYANRGCRCEPCASAMSAYNAAYYQRKRAA